MPEEMMLTPRVFYHFFSSCEYMGSTRRKLLRKQYSLKMTGFWNNLLGEVVPGVLLDGYFNTKQKRNRQLSDMMNHTRLNAMPLRLYNAMEEYLTEDRFLCALRWLHDMLDPSLSPVALNSAVTEFENKYLPRDTVMCRYASFFEGLRVSGSALPGEKLTFLAALRLTLLGMHSIYGDRAHESSALAKLRQSNVCNVNDAWEMAEMRKFNPEYGAPHFEKPAEPGDAPSIEKERSFLSASAIDRVYEALPTDTSFIKGGSANGWYVVANWTDECVSLNDKPWATYVGAKELAQIKNGTLLYVSAAEYHGIHCSPSLWGYTQYKGIIGCVPLNLMVKIEKPD